MEMTPEQVVEKINSLIAEKTANSVSKEELDAFKSQLSALEGKSDVTEVKSAIAKLEGLLQAAGKEKDDLRMMILDLTKQVAALSVKVEFLTKENEKLSKTSTKSEKKQLNG